LAHCLRGHLQDQVVERRAQKYRLVKLQNRLVNFRVCDVHFPEPEKVLAELFGHHLLQGRVTGATVDSAGGGQFAIVEVDGIEKPVFVPIDRILGIV
jgi:phosphoglycolate phosphatase-like HAD superfamily hydrolase